MKIGNVNSVRGPEEVGPARVAQTPRPPVGPSVVPLPQDSIRLKGASSAEPEVKQKSLAECREAFKAGLTNLKGQTDDDRAAIKDLAKMVNDRPDLNSKEKEWLFATEMITYTADVAMQMTGWEKKGQPWTPKQQARFEGVSQTFAAAKDVVAAVTPMVEKPDGSLPSFESASAGEGLRAAPLNTAPLSGSVAASNVAVTNTAPPADSTPPANGVSSDPLVRIWESRRQEAQDMFNDYAAMMQKVSEWKARICASRISFFWKVYGAHAGFLNDSWKK